ncbi:hypothetical protein PoB_006800700 [Plakobranchus ocellatus]|uniref:Uncharacterized protein n=1 Tax=Plakobranchus ocellatus TaxID=259542 RepID=A0AAV4DBA6_9GAST|nr:hypothetical protein PoB_006800700 [Plakobranchus ocellatus]
MEYCKVQAQGSDPEPSDNDQGYATICAIIIFLPVSFYFVYRSAQFIDDSPTTTVDRGPRLMPLRLASPGLKPYMKDAVFRTQVLAVLPLLTWLLSVHKKVISGFQAILQAKTLVGELKSATEGPLQISGRTR